MDRDDQPPGVGNKLIRLADIPLDQRLRALSRALRTAKTDQEALRLLMLAVDPKNAGGRIAA